MKWAAFIERFRQRFTRVTSSVQFIPQIDGLRFLAMLLVLAHHVFAAYLEQTHRLGTQQLPRDWTLIAKRSALVSWALHLWIGVPLFCAISGFVLTIPFARSYLKGSPPPSRKIYLLRRLVRMEPPYILNMLFMFLVLVIPWHQTDPMGYFRANVHVFTPHLAASLTYLHSAIYAQASWINGVAWTLEIEVQFYLVLPVLAELFRIRRSALRRGILIGLVLASALISQFAVQPSGSARLNLTLALQLQFFIAGVLLADIYLDLPRILRLKPPVADLLALLNAALLVYVLHWNPQLAWTEPFLIVGFCFAVFYGTWTSLLFRLPLLTIPGGMCYSVYLYHFFIVRHILPETVRLFPAFHALWWDAGVQFLLLLIPVFGVSAVIFLFTERPFMLLSHDVARRFRPAVVASSVGA